MNETDQGLFRLKDGLMDISIKDLFYFIVAADEGNITRAAQRLYISQPTLSKHIMTLEERLGLTLFRRGERTLTLTRQGKYFYSRWKAQLLKVQSDYEQGKMMSNSDVNTLRIGCFPVLNSNRYLHAYTENLNLRYPDISLELTNSDYANLLDGLNSRRLDVIFIPVEDLPENRDCYEYHTVRTSPVVAVIPVSNELSGQSILNPSQFSGETILLAEPSGKLSRRDRHIEMLAKNGLRPDSIHCVGNYLTAYTEAEHNRGVALGIRSVFPIHNDSVCVTDIAGIKLDIAAVWNKGTSDEVKHLIKSMWAPCED